MKPKNSSFFTTIKHSFLAITLSIGLIVVLTTYLSYKTPFETVGSMIERAGLNNIFLAFFQSENHYFVQEELSLNKVSLYKLGLELAANIRTDDIRTFFGRELPGMSYYATQIQVAGDGTDITNLPIESAPPIEIMLKEREVAQDALLHGESDNTKQNKPPSRTTYGKKVVYIYQSHSWESYLPLLKNANTPDEAVSSNNLANIVGVGEKLRKELESKGIGTDHNTINANQKLLERGWNYNNSYQLSRGIVQEAMASNKNIQFALDIHRDSLRKDKTTVKIGEKNYARLVFILGQANPNYQQNLEIAKEIHSAIQEKYPGLSRGVFSKGKSEGNGVYNQDLSKRALLIEFGGVDNNLIELDNTIDAFTDIFSNYYWKTKDAGEI